MDDWERTALTAPLGSAEDGKRPTGLAWLEDDNAPLPLGWSFDLTAPPPGQPTTSQASDDSAPSSAPVAGAPNDGLRAGLVEANLLLSDAILDDLLGFGPPGSKTAALPPGPTVHPPVKEAAATVSGGAGLGSARPIDPAPFAAASPGSVSRSHGAIAPLSLGGAAGPQASGGFSTLSGSGGSGGFISGRAWADADEDGLQQTGESGVADVLVELFDTGDNFIASTTTDGSGAYQFTGVTPGEYYLDFTAPDGYDFTLLNAGPDDIDSDADPDNNGQTASFVVFDGSLIESIDAGLIAVGGSGGTIGDYVWEDTNGDGIQDAGENGIGGVTVQLLDAATDEVVAEAVTDDLGHYQFSDVDPDEQYRIRVVLPAGYAATAPYTGSEDADSNIDGGGYSEAFFVEDGATNLTLDAGLLATTPGTVGDRVWLDDNGDGLQDVDELGFPDVTVNLYDVASTLIATTTTDTDGYYQFTGLAPNTYYFLDFIPPEGYGFTVPLAGPPDGDSDADEYGFTDWFWVAAGTVNLTLDAGLQPAAPAAEPVIEILYPGPGVKKADKLRVAKWANAFENVGGTNRVKNDFIRLDPDRFFVRVDDGAANTNPAAKDTIKVRVSTTSDAGNDIVLEETDVNTGRFWSRDWLLLTSFQVDDEYRVGGIADNTEGDPTFLVKLDDMVTATYGTRTATARVPTEKVVKLHINILRNRRMADGGTPVIAQADVEAHVAVATKIYAPVGIRFDATIQIVDPPAGVDLSNGLDEFPGLDAAGKALMTAEEKALLDVAALRTAAKDDIEVYYVGSLRLGGAPGSNGETFAAANAPDAKYADSIIIGTAVYRTLAHEIGHALMNNGYHPDGRVGAIKVNLMASPFQVDGTVTDSRRINAPAGADPRIDVQAKDMLEKRPNLLSNP